jgi:hypothetical protein
MINSYDEKMVLDKKCEDNLIENVKNNFDDFFPFILLLINKLNVIQDKNLKNFISDHILDTAINYGIWS